LIEAVVERLGKMPEGDRGIGSRLGPEWEILKNVLANEEQKAFCERAARLGYDPFSVQDSIAEQIEGLRSVLPEPMIDDFCDAIPLSQIASGADAVRTFIESAVSVAPAPARWNDVPRSAHASNSDTPWRDGYQQAATFRAFLALNGHTPDDLEEFLSRTMGDFRVRDFPAPSRIDAISSLFRGSAPVFGIPSHLRADKRRFVIARAIGDFLSFGHSSLVTRGQTEHQQRNRAFAAEFLAPAHSIRERLPNATVDEEDVEELAAEFQVSPIVIRHQIQNHRLAEFSG
jgi:IrrE N-terminal-like domain